MTIRKKILPRGWYPWDEEGIRGFVEESLEDFKAGPFSAGIVPHAGWAYSGDMACRVIASLETEPHTLVIVGGHLPGGSLVLGAFEDMLETPLGLLECDKKLMEYLRKELPIQEDREPDNTVEVQLPFVKYFFPQTRVLSLRAAPGEVAVALGQAVFRGAKALGRKVVFLGSTDLTHYGSHYGFSPRGDGAVQWVKEVNDKGFIDGALALDVEKMLFMANIHKAACSAGGAVAAVSFARAAGFTESSLVEYKTSYDIHPAESFVGYAGIGYR